MRNIEINKRVCNELGLRPSEAIVLGYLSRRKEVCDWFSPHEMAIELAFISSDETYLKRLAASLQKKGAITVRKTNGYEYRFTLTFSGEW